MQKTCLNKWYYRVTEVEKLVTRHSGGQYMYLQNRAWRGEVRSSFPLSKYTVTVIITTAQPHVNSVADGVLN